MEVVGGSGCTEVGGDGGEWREQHEADGVPHEVPLVVPHSRSEQPAGEGPGVARHSVLLLAQLAGVLVDRGEPLLYAGPVHQSHRPGAEAGGDQSLPSGLSVVADPAEHTGGVLAGLRQQ